MVYETSTKIVAKSLLPLAAAVGVLCFMAFKPITVPISPEPEGVVVVGPVTVAEPLAYIAPIHATPSVKHASVARKTRTDCGTVTRPLVQGRGDVVMSGDWGCR
jgi:hypothetical protein